MGRNSGGGGRKREVEVKPEEVKRAEISAKTIKKSLVGLDGYKVEYKIKNQENVTSRVYDIETSGNKITISNGTDKREIEVQGNLPDKKAVIDQRFKQYLGSLDGSETLHISVNDNSLEITEITARTRLKSRFALLDEKGMYSAWGTTVYEMRPKTNDTDFVTPYNRVSETNFRRVDQDNK